MRDQGDVSIYIAAPRRWGEIGMAMPKYLYYYLFLDNTKHMKEDLPSLQNLKKDYIRYILKVTDCNISEASEILQVSPPTLYKKLKNFRVH